MKKRNTKKQGPKVSRNQKKQRNLEVSEETLRVLDVDELADVAGGVHMSLGCTMGGDG